MNKAHNMPSQDERYQTNFATKPDIKDSEVGDPMELMVKLPGGGYDMARYVKK